LIVSRVAPIGKIIVRRRLDNRLAAINSIRENYGDQEGKRVCDVVKLAGPSRSFTQGDTG
jgi:hypothetical protein